MMSCLLLFTELAEVHFRRPVENKYYSDHKCLISEVLI